MSSLFKFSGSQRPGEKYATAFAGPSGVGVKTGIAGPDTVR